MAGFGRSPFGRGPFGRSDTGHDLVVRSFPVEYFDDSIVLDIGETPANNDKDPLLKLIKTYAHQVFKRRLDIDRIPNLLDFETMPLEIVRLWGDMLGLGIDKNDPEFLQRSFLGNASQWLQIKASTRGYEVRGLASGFDVSVENFWRIDEIYAPLIPARFKYLLKPRDADESALKKLHTDSPPGTHPGTPTSEDSTYAKSSYVRIVFSVHEPRNNSVNYNTLLDLVIDKIRDVVGIHHEMQAPQFLVKIPVDETTITVTMLIEEFGVFNGSETYIYDITPADEIPTDTGIYLTMTTGDGNVLTIDTDIGVTGEITEFEYDLILNVAPYMSVEYQLESEWALSVDEAISIDWTTSYDGFDVQVPISVDFLIEAFENYTPYEIEVNASIGYQSNEIDNDIPVEAADHYDLTPGDLVIIDSQSVTIQIYDITPVEINMSIPVDPEADMGSSGSHESITFIIDPAIAAIREIDEESYSEVDALPTATFQLGVTHSDIELFVDGSNTTVEFIEQEEPFTVVTEITSVISASSEEIALDFPVSGSADIVSEQSPALIEITVGEFASIENQESINTGDSLSITTAVESIYESAEPVVMVGETIDLITDSDVIELFVSASASPLIDTQESLNDSVETSIDTVYEIEQEVDYIVLDAPLQIQVILVSDSNQMSINVNESFTLEVNESSTTEADETVTATLTQAQESEGINFEVSVPLSVELVTEVDQFIVSVGETASLEIAEMASGDISEPITVSQFIENEVETLLFDINVNVTADLSFLTAFEVTVGETVDYGFQEVLSSHISETVSAEQFVEQESGSIFFSISANITAEIDISTALSVPVGETVSIESSEHSNASIEELVTVTQVVGQEIETLLFEVTVNVTASIEFAVVMPVDAAGSTSIDSSESLESSIEESITVSQFIEDETETLLFNINVSISASIDFATAMSVSAGPEALFQSSEQSEVESSVSASTSMSRVDEIWNVGSAVSISISVTDQDQETFEVDALPVAELISSEFVQESVSETASATIEKVDSILDAPVSISATVNSSTETGESVEINVTEVVSETAHEYWSSDISETVLVSIQRVDAILSAGVEITIDVLVSDFVIETIDIPVSGSASYIATESEEISLQETISIGSSADESDLLAVSVSPTLSIDLEDLSRTAVSASVQAQFDIFENLLSELSEIVSSEISSTEQQNISASINVTAEISQEQDSETIEINATIQVIPSAFESVLFDSEETTSTTPILHESTGLSAELTFTVGMEIEIFTQVTSTSIEIPVDVNESIDFISSESSKIDQPGVISVDSDSSSENLDISVAASATISNLMNELVSEMTAETSLTIDYREAEEGEVILSIGAEITVLLEQVNAIITIPVGETLTTAFSESVSEITLSTLMSVTFSPDEFDAIFIEVPATPSVVLEAIQATLFISAAGTVGSQVSELVDESVSVSGTVQISPAEFESITMNVNASPSASLIAEFTQMSASVGESISEQINVSADIFIGLLTSLTESIAELEKITINTPPTITVEFQERLTASASETLNISSSLSELATIGVTLSSSVIFTREAENTQTWSINTGVNTTYKLNELSGGNSALQGWWVDPLRNFDLTAADVAPTESSGYVTMTITVGP